MLPAPKTRFAQQIEFVTAPPLRHLKKIFRFNFCLKNHIAKNFVSVAQSRGNISIVDLDPVRFQRLLPSGPQNFHQGKSRGWRVSFSGFFPQGSGQNIEAPPDPDKSLALGYSVPKTNRDEIIALG